jgi:ABC-type amino acid transport substrate-binding protein
MQTLVTLAMVVALLLTAAPAPLMAQSVLDEIKQRGELRVAGVLYRPLISPRPNGEYVGLDVEVLKKIAADLGVKLNIINSEWATAVAGIETKKWDIVPALCVTDKRKEVVDFVITDINIGATLVTLASNPKNLTTIEAYNRPEVVFAVPAGAWSEAVAKEVAPKATHKAFGQTTSADLLQEVIAGRADAVVLDTPIQTTVALSVHGNRLRIVPGHEKPLDVRACRVGYAHQKGDRKFGQYLEDFLRKLKEKGELAALYKQFMTAEQIRATQ